MFSFIRLFFLFAAFFAVSMAQLGGASTGMGPNNAGNYGGGANLGLAPQPVYTNAGVGVQPVVGKK